MFNKYNRHWLDWFKRQSASKRSEVIIKVKEKYSSKKYRDYWTSLGYYELPEDLLWMLLWYGEEYGKASKLNTYKVDFSTEAWIIDDRWVVKRHDFLESYVSVQTIEEDKLILEKIESYAKD